jgi:hypothetical protein
VGFCTARKPCGEKRRGGIMPTERDTENWDIHFNRVIKKTKEKITGDNREYDKNRELKVSDVRRAVSALLARNDNAPIHRAGKGSKDQPLQTPETRKGD